MKPAFRIHPQLFKDCHVLGRLEHSHLLLHRNALLHWFILVPETKVADLLDMDVGMRTAVVGESARVSAFLKSRLGYPKVNFAAIGNVVPQLHLHVVGRRPGDPAWPAPIWGHLSSASEYTAEQVARITAILKEHCQLQQMT